jgi:enhancer of polycomb-like protein
MTTEDDEFLKVYNQNKPSGAKCSENDFEKIMEVFEKTADLVSPFASVDNTVVPFETMKDALNERIEQKFREKIHRVARDIYEFWKSRRQGSGNKPLQPSLKFEINQENDDGDPYVCFRRREVRQTRKTRARDVQSTDRLKRLRKELDEGRQLVITTHQRELIKRNLLKADKDIFEKRASVKDTKVRLGIKDGDEDLINQKVSNFQNDNLPPADIHSLKRDERQIIQWCGKALQYACLAVLMGVRLIPSLYFSLMLLRTKRMR